MRRSLRALLAVLLALVATSPARAADLDLVRVGSLSSVSDAPFYIAEKKGYFRDAGIRVEFVTFPSGAAMIGPLATGQLDAGGGAPAAGLYNALGRGITIRIVAERGTDAPGYGMNPIMVRKDLITSGRVKSLADLRGLRVAEPAKGSTTAATLARALGTVHLAYDDVQHVYLGFPEQVAAFKNGSIDASVTLEPWGTLSEREGVAKKLVGNDTFYPNQELAVLLYGSTFTDKREDVAKRFMVAYLRGVRYYHDALRSGRIGGPNASDVIAILGESIGIKDTSVLREMTPAYVDADGRVNVRSLAEDFAVFRKMGYLTPDATFTGLVDTRYVDAARKQLGPYKPRS